MFWFVAKGMTLYHRVVL